MLVRSARLGTLGLALVLCAALPAAAAPLEEGEPGTTAEIRIALPVGQPALVALSPGPDRVLIELPRGARYPSDFAAVSSGLLGPAEIEDLGGDRIRVNLPLLQGALEQVVYEPDAVRLRFQSHLAIAGAPLDLHQQYLIGPDDRLAVRVHGHPDYDAELVVTREGMITWSLVGDVRVEGLSPQQLATKLSDMMASYLVQPQVDVEIKEYRSQWVTVSGAMVKPGRISLRGGTRLKEVLGDAGMFDKDAGQTIRVSRRVEGGGPPATLTIDRRDFETGRVNPLLAHGDIIEIAAAADVYIQGAVRNAGNYPAEQDLTLLRAISLAGGLSEWADESDVKVLNPQGVEPRERVFNLKKIKNGKSEDPLLAGGEVIIVGKRFL